MPQNITHQQSYSHLVKSIQTEISKAEKDIKNRLVLMYWRIGKMITNNLLANQDRAGYGDQLFERLSKQLKKNKSMLHHSVKFYKCYPIVSPGTQLTWTHYKSLIYVENTVLRNRLQRKIVKNEISVSDLRKEIKDIKSAIRHKAWRTGELSATMGTLYLYQVLDGRSKDPSLITVDVGFRLWREIKIQAKQKPKPGQVIRTTKVKEAYEAQVVTVKPSERYTYKGEIYKIVDGDTLWVNIDLGLRAGVFEKLRLRGIDTPELKTKEGLAAKRFVQRHLKPKDPIIIKTHLNDKFDRPLADVWINDGSIYLNQLLLDRGYAQKY